MAVVFLPVPDPELESDAPEILLPDPHPERRRVDAAGSGDAAFRVAYTLEFLHLAEDEFAALADFHARHAPDNAEFLWRDVDGLERRARFEGALESLRRTRDDWGVRVVLASGAAEAGDPETPEEPEAGGARFAFGAVVVDWPAPSPERRVEIRRRQAEGWSASGVRQLQDGVGRTRVEGLAFSGITDAQRAAMEDFFGLVGGARDVFEFSEPPGAARVVRFAEGRVAWVRLGRDRWRGDLALACDLLD